VPAPLTPVTLVGRHVRLEPLSLDHVPDLVAAASLDRSTYDWTNVPDGTDAMRHYVEGLLADQAAAEVLPFAQCRIAGSDDGGGDVEVVGCTRLMEPRWWSDRATPHEIEIGGTWLGAAAQRTAVNTEAKLLLLGYAFGELDVWRVAICTDDRNEQSRRAIERLGATFEGILRNHRPRYDTTSPMPRQSAMYSITVDDWPDVERRLRDRLG